MLLYAGVKILGAFCKFYPNRENFLKKIYTVETQREQRKNLKSLLRTHKQSTSI